MLFNIRVESKGLATDKNIKNLDALQKRFMQSLSYTAAITSVTLGDLMGSNECKSLLYRTEDCCAIHMLKDISKNKFKVASESHIAKLRSECPDIARLQRHLDIASRKALAQSTRVCKSRDAHSRFTPPRNM
ncbi:uncharacterized protein BXIN_1681 [Babesia sp. Xinjiang]|uniref:uncharacterized protein n=1 Tax=Babesia sp. Xinjiang TaxID=462227 RepID=UPI000A228AB0|nr:uncharacterized protein BXIN_1738 [Babesia sp. Xinjiang]XP_028871427.1 uncharacterized protein BXIN_1681 [Babesia sp. Xinjiang]ORM40884.1 hypothetical protein BXIN_1738 [Babesia sp. Xinjiang]ORM40971.1 hypothetical protein BXIN_1681 [Babesia sp. Xinjiang]